MPRARRTAASSSRVRRSPEDKNKSIRLTVKVKTPPSRLREIKSTSPDDDVKTRQPRTSLSRNSKNKKPIVDESSDEDEADGVDEDGEGEDDEMDEDEEEDEEMRDVDADDGEEEEEDEDEEDVVHKPTIKISAPGSVRGQTQAQSRNQRKPTPTQALKQSRAGKIKSVEEKEMQSSAATSDQELSSGPAESEEQGEEEEEDDEEQEDEENLEDEEEDSDDEGSGQPPQLPPTKQTVGTTNPAGDTFDEDEDDDDRHDTIKADALHESDLDSSASSSGTPNSRDGTPDLSKLTRRQRHGLLDSSSDLMALSNEAQKKKFFTAEQITMRRAEMARRRKDLSERRNREEKEDTLKRLLEKPAPKRRSRAQMLADAEREEFGEGGDFMPVERGCVRLVSGRNGSRVGVPAEWLDGPVGELFRRGDVTKRGEYKVIRPGRMVEEVE